MTDQTDTEPVEQVTSDLSPEEDSSPGADAPPESGGTHVPPDDDPETFPREYVQRLRDESARYRQRASDRDALAERLHTSLVTATGRLADPTDLAFDESHLTDPEALTAAVDDLLARKPHLAARRIVGDVGQGAGGSDTAVDLAGMLRRNAS